MTTSNSPPRDIRVQADKIAAMLKDAERGKGSLGTRSKESITFVIAMDDKILNIEMTWVVIRDTDEAGIAEYIFDQMREAKDTVQ